MKKWINFGLEQYRKHREVIDYLVFGGLATLLNFVLAFVFIRWMGMSTAIGNILDNVVCILFAFTTNRIWVFRSKTKGLAALREFLSFVACRIGTMVMDEIIMVVGVDYIGPMLPAEYNLLWFMAVKLLAQILVIVSNYVLSKLIIFKKVEK